VGDPDGVALFVVAQPDAVVDARGEVDAVEPPLQLCLIVAGHDEGGVVRGWP